MCLTFNMPKKVIPYMMTDVGKDHPQLYDRRLEHIPPLLPLTLSVRVSGVGLRDQAVGP